MLSFGLRRMRTQAGRKDDDRDGKRAAQEERQEERTKKREREGKSAKNEVRARRERRHGC